MKGVITIGVRETATYLFDTADPIKSPNPPPATYNETAISTKTKKHFVSSRFKLSAKQHIKLIRIGKMKNIGISLVTFAKKYAGTLYIPDACSLKNTGHSSGKSKIKL